MIKKFKFFLLSLFACSLCSCGATPAPVPPKPVDPILVESINFDLSSNRVVEGETVTITNVEVLPANATNKEVTFTLSNDVTATIDGTTITTVREGLVYVIATAKDGSMTTGKTLLTVDKNVIHVTEVNLLLPKTEFVVGEEFTPTVNIKPSNASNKNYSLIVNPSENVRIYNGTITCLKKGNVQIIAAADDGGIVSASLMFKIKNIEPSSISANVGKSYIAVNEETPISYKVLPENALEKDVSFAVKSGTNNVISISDDGVVTGVAPGSDYVVVYCTNYPEISCEVKVEVYSVAATSIELTVDKSELVVGDITVAHATVKPTNATDKDVSFKTKSGNTDVIKVFSDGSIKANGSGEEYVVAYLTHKASVSAEVKVTVVSIEPTEIITEVSKTSLNIGETVQITATVIPSYALDKAVSYVTESGNENVVSVSSSGLVTAKGEGTDKVIVKCTNFPSVKKEIEFTVTSIPATGVNATVSKSKLYLDETVNIQSSVIPSNATDKSISYKLSSSYTRTSGNVFEAENDLTLNLGREYSLDETITLDIKFDNIDSRKICFMLGETWNSYFGYFTFKDNGELGEQYDGVTKTLLSDGYYRLTFDLGKLTKQNDKPLPTEYIDFIYIRGSYTTGSGLIEVNSTLIDDVVTVSSTGVVTAHNKGKQKVVVYLTNNPSISEEIEFEVINNPKDATGDDIFTV